VLRKILIVIIAILFTCSALELELGEAKQTFFDAYDIYIPSKPIKVRKYQTSNSKAKSFKPIKKNESGNWFLNFGISFRTIIGPSDIAYYSLLSTHQHFAILLKKSELRI